MNLICCDNVPEKKVAKEKDFRKEPLLGEVFLHNMIRISQAFVLVICVTFFLFLLIVCFMGCTNYCGDLYE